MEIKTNELYFKSPVGYHKVGVVMNGLGGKQRIPMQIMLVSEEDMLRGGTPENCETVWIMNPYGKVEIEKWA